MYEGCCKNNSFGTKKRNTNEIITVFVNKSKAKKDDANFSSFSPLLFTNLNTLYNE